MKKTHLHVFLFLSALIGASFSFWYLINRPFNSNQLTDIESYASIINHGLFSISLFLMLYTFFVKKNTFSMLGIGLIFIGLLYLVLIFSYTEARYSYIIPLGVYTLTGFLMFHNMKLSKKR